MNPQAHNSDEPPRYYSWYLFDPKTSTSSRPTDTSLRSPTPRWWPENLSSAERSLLLAQMLCKRRQLHRRRRIPPGPARPEIEGFSPDMCWPAACSGVQSRLSSILFYERQRSVEAQLRRAIRKDKLTLVYQPVVDLETWEIVGAEALVRWENDAGEMVKPEFFIALAEEKGFCNQITQLVLRKSLGRAQQPPRGRKTFASPSTSPSESSTTPASSLSSSRSSRSANVQPTGPWPRTHGTLHRRPYSRIPRHRATQASWIQDLHRRLRHRLLQPRLPPSPFEVDRHQDRPRLYPDRRQPGRNRIGGSQDSCHRSRAESAGGRRRYRDQRAGRVLPKNRHWNSGAGLALQRARLRSHARKHGSQSGPKQGSRQSGS